MKGPLAYVGGKSKLAKTIIKQIPEHRTYCEVFMGGGWIFFGKAQSKVEVINDLDGDLIAFYRVLKYHLEEFLKQFKWLLSSREFFNDFKDQLETRGLTDIQRAARYYYVQRQAYGGKVKDRVFGVSPERRPSINLVRMEEELSEVHLRLSGVRIENLDWKEFVKRYDKARTFFYIDPPYYKTLCYKYNFESIDDFKNINNILKGIKGKFILSINDHKDIREVFKDFKMQQVKLNYSLGKNGNKAEELIIQNY